MAENGKFYVNLSGLISQARLQNGFATLRELYRIRNPTIDYQTWLHAESGRRIPAANIVIQIGKILNIDREALIIAYCKDKFDDEESHMVLESFRYKKFVNPNNFISVKEHDRSDYIFTSDQVKAMQKDVRLRLFLSYTYDNNYNTTVERLAKFFNCEVVEVRRIVTLLEALDLVRINGDQIHRIHRNTVMPRSPEVYDLRKRFLMQSLEINIRDDSYIANCHAIITEESYKKFLSYLDFVEANLVQLNKDDATNEERTQYQVAIIANKIRRDFGDK